VSKKIILITSSQPSLNPRLVKEADALVEAGHDVTVIYQYWNRWATQMDTKLLPKKKWKIIRVGGDPLNENILYWKTRMRLKIARIFINFFGFKNNMAEMAIGRCTLQLAKKAKHISADFYISHNLAALPAAVMAAKYNSAKCGFDAEDLHRYEMSDDDTDKDVRLKKYMEEKYFPLVNYITTSSPEITKKYESIFPTLTFTTILNVFQKNKLKLTTNKSDLEPLKLFWFSQNVGLSRGLQDVLGALKILEHEQIEFHVLGFLSSSVKIQLGLIIKNLEFIKLPKITFYEPIESTEIPFFASKFDIGLATEPGFSVNNDIALSNKIFTYVQAGLAIIVSDTKAQNLFLTEYPSIGVAYEKKNSMSLASQIKNYIEHKETLAFQKNQSKHYANIQLNWEVEKGKFLSIIEDILITN
jgi:hypothetical protein